MMIDPPIDKLIEKAECGYALVCAISKRAMEIASSQEGQNTFNMEPKPVSQAAMEIYRGQIKIIEGE